MTIDDLHKKDHKYLEKLILRTLRAKANQTMMKGRALDECLTFLRRQGMLTGQLKAVEPNQQSCR